MWYRIRRALARRRAPVDAEVRDGGRSVLTDGGDPEEPDDADREGTHAPDAEGQDDAADDPGTEVGGSNVEVTDPGEAEPADPKWRKPDPEDIPEFEVRADEPVASGGTGIGGESADAGEDAPEDPTAGMPNTARAPGATRISSEGTEAYVAAVELCARLPDDVRLPEEAADLVPAAVEAELEQDVQQFAATEFGAERPHVDVLDFLEVDGEIWLRLRIGLPTADFEALDPEAVRSYALERLEGVL